MEEIEKKFKWALKILHPDNMVATPDDKMKAWLYLNEYSQLMFNG